MNSTQAPNTDSNNSQTTTVINVCDQLHDRSILFVSLADAASILGIAKSTAYASYRSTGFLVDGVPIRKSGRRRYLVATAHLRVAAGIANE